METGYRRKDNGDYFEKKIMKNENLAKILFLFLSISAYSAQTDNIPVRDFEVTPIFDLNTLKPEVEIIPFLNNFFSVDKEENIYFVDVSNHRVLKFGINGDFIAQIGSIGQREKDLYYPQGLFLKGDRLFALNYEGREIKIFNTNGKFISGFRIPDASTSFALYVHDEQIITDTKYKDLRNFNLQKLLSLFNKKGEKVKSVGKILKCQTFTGYEVFNSAFINMIDNSFVIALANYPLIFRCDLNGKEIFYKDLIELEINEIRELQERIFKLGMDTPESIKEKNAVRSSVYCSGLGISLEKQIYYALMNSCYLLHLNERGDIVEKLKLKIQNEPLRVEKININEMGNFYGIGILHKEKKKIFFKF
jgi:hypothetical protein